MLRKNGKPGAVPLLLMGVVLLCLFLAVSSCSDRDSAVMPEREYKTAEGHSNQEVRSFSILDAIKQGFAEARRTDVYHQIAPELERFLGNTGETNLLAAPSSHIAGDVNEDGIIDIADIVLLARHFGTSKGEPLYDARYDFNSDGEIDLLDLIIAARNFGAVRDITPPVIQVINGDNLSLDEDHLGYKINFNFGDDSKANSEINLTVSSSHPGYVPVSLQRNNPTGQASIIIAPSGPNVTHDLPFSINLGASDGDNSASKVINGVLKNSHFIIDGKLYTLETLEPHSGIVEVGGKIIKTDANGNYSALIPISSIIGGNLNVQASWSNNNGVLDIGDSYLRTVSLKELNGNDLNGLDILIASRPENMTHEQYKRFMNIINTSGLHQGGLGMHFAGFKGYEMGIEHLIAKTSLLTGISGTGGEFLEREMELYEEAFDYFVSLLPHFDEVSEPITRGERIDFYETDKDNLPYKTIMVLKRPDRNTACVLHSDSNGLSYGGFIFIDGLSSLGEERLLSGILEEIFCEHGQFGQVYDDDLNGKTIAHEKVGYSEVHPADISSVRTIYVISYRTDLAVILDSNLIDGFPQIRDGIDTVYTFPVLR